MTGPAAEEPDLLEGGTEPPRWRRAWAALSPWGRRGLVAAVVVALAATGVVLLRERAADQERRERVALTTTLGVVSSSTVPPGGSVRFFVVVRNDGELPLSITAIEGAGEGLRVRMGDEVDRRIEAGREAEIPLSVRVTCPAGAGEIAADLHVRRQDGGTTTRRAALRPASWVTDVAATVCAVRPDLRDHELSGPVLRGDVTPGDRDG